MKNNVYKIPWPRLTKLWNRVVIIFKINPPEYMAPHSNVMLPVGWYVKPHKELNDHLIIYDDTDDEIGLIWHSAKNQMNVMFFFQ